MATSHKNTEKIRQKIIQSTDELLYKKGFNLMSFTDIAEASGIPRGNIYYHFKTKDDVLAAAVDYRVTQIEQMLEGWNQTLKTPLERLKRYAHIPINEKERVIKYGCPMGTLSSELGKKQAGLQVLAKQPIDAFKYWIIEQFQQYCPDKNAKSLTDSLLIRMQGMSILAHTYHNQEMITQEVEAINKWLDSL